MFNYIGLINLVITQCCCTIRRYYSIHQQRKMLRQMFIGKGEGKSLQMVWMCCTSLTAVFSSYQMLWASFSLNAQYVIRVVQLCFHAFICACVKLIIIFLCQFASLRNPFNGKKRGWQGGRREKTKMSAIEMRTYIWDEHTKPTLLQNTQPHLGNCQMHRGTSTSYCTRHKMKLSWMPWLILLCTA